MKKEIKLINHFSFKLKLVLALFLLLIFTDNHVYSQQDTVLLASVDNFYVDYAAVGVEFDINLTRTDDLWHLWTNATLQLKLYEEDNTEIDYSKYNITITKNNSDILVDLLSKVYELNAKLMDDRLMIIVTGSENYFDLKMFEKDETLRLCRVRLTPKASNAPLPTHITWATPIEYYQATAYKYVAGVDTPLEETLIEVRNNDNIEIASGVFATRFKNSTERPSIETVIEEFRATYVGNLNVVLNWSTKSEFLNNGFVIKRAEYLHLQDGENIETIDDSYFNITVGDYRLPEYKDRMTGLFTSDQGKVYEPIIDTIPMRNTIYLYRLYYHHGGNNQLIRLATDTLLTPNYTISHASASPNPFKDMTQIRYVLEDDVYMTCELYDALGKKVKNLSDNELGVLDRTYVKLGEHFATLSIPPELVSQGFCEVIFTAYPINNPFLQIAKSSVKLQMIK
jgi:hypothetical protein